MSEEVDSEVYPSEDGKKGVPTSRPLYILLFGFRRYHDYPSFFIFSLGYHFRFSVSRERHQFTIVWQ